MDAELYSLKLMKLMVITDLYESCYWLEAIKLLFQ
jgi:hypothetical protein